MIKILLILNLIISLGISIFLIFKFVKYYKDQHTKKIFFLFFLLGGVFILLSLVLFSWIFNLGKYNSLDLLFIHSIILFIESILLLAIIYSIRKSKKIFYLLSIHGVFILSVLIGIDFSNFLVISSLFLIMVLFILMISSPNFGRSSKFAILYSSMSLFLQVLIFFQKEFSPIVSLISNTFFIIFLFFFFLDLKKLPKYFFERRTLKFKHNNYFFDFLRYFVFIIILTNFIFIGVLTIHEGGHFLISKTNPNCDLERIVYEGGLPHTEIICNNNVGSLNMIISGGIFLPLLIALLFFFGGGTFMKEISLLIIGFNILISYEDFLDLGFSTNISGFFSIFGGAIVLFAIAILAKSRTTEEEFIHLADS